MNFKKILAFYKKIWYYIEENKNRNNSYFGKELFVVKKYSKQREEVLNFITESHTHLTAEEIYLALKANNSTASRGTVYRNLSVLVEDDVIIKLPMDNGPDKYDYIHEPHHHAMCKKCGKVYDFDYKIDIKKLKKAIILTTELENISDYIIVQGICKNCQKV